MSGTSRLRKFKIFEFVWLACASSKIENRCDCSCNIILLILQKTDNLIVRANQLVQVKQKIYLMVRAMIILQNLNKKKYINLNVTVNFYRARAEK